MLIGFHVSTVSTDQRILVLR